RLRPLRPRGPPGDHPRPQRLLDRRTGPRGGASMRAMGTPEGAELRLALAMRGGVSLAVWIGGASAEIDALRRAADEKEGFWWELLQVSPYSRVVVDVMAGASAGGLNGVLFASAIRHGFRMDGLLDTWRRVAGVGTLT